MTGADDAPAVQAPPHEVMLASAGAGKTFQLTNRYLVLLASGVPAERILATTFTRKAAGEILDRILERLAGAAASDAGAAKLCADLGHSRAADSPPLPALDRAEWARLLGGLARGIDRCQVRTIDSWFVHLIGLFGLEMGLPTGWRIAEAADVAALQTAAESALLADDDLDSVVELLRDIARHGKEMSAGVHRALDAVVQDAHDLWTVSRPEAWQAYAPPPGCSADQLVESLAALEALELPRTKAGKPDARWHKAVQKLIGEARRGDWSALAANGFATKLAAGEPYYKHEADEDTRAHVLRVLGHAAGHVLALLTRNTQGYARLLTRYDTELRALQHERRLLTFGDLPRTLLGETLDEPDDDATPPALDPDAVTFRGDGSLEHLLLDEFQDTALPQWRVLEPLVERLLAADGGTSVFCVGDVKQSIYGWRGGESTLLAELAGRFAALHASTLSKSWRSSAVVLRTVDRAFEGLLERPPFDEGPGRRRGAGRWLGRYEPHATAKEALPGYACLRRLEVPEPSEDGDEGDDAAAAYLDRVADHVAGITREAPGVGVGVLLRANRHIAGLIQRLRARGVRASGEGGTPLDDSDCVELALSMLTLADHPGHGPARLHLETSPLAASLGLDPRAAEREVDDAGDPGADRLRAIDRLRERRAAGAASRWRRRLVERGYGPTLATLGERLHAACPELSPWERRRFGQLVDLGFAFDARAGLRPGAFVDLVRRTPVEDATASPVKVMTVHKSKGLEFPVVVLPELHGSRTFARAHGLIGRRPDPWQGPDLVVSGVSRTLAALDPRLDELATAETALGVEEDLCVLYVAMTRAERRLDLLVPSRPDPPTRSYATLLLAALAGEPAPGDDELLFEDGDAAGWSAGLVRGPSTAEAHATDAHATDAHDAEPLATAAHATPTPATDAHGAPPAPAAAPVRLARQAPSSREGEDELFGVELLTLDTRARRARGTLWHGWFEQVTWIDELPDERRLRDVARRLDPGLDEAWLADELRAFRAALGQPAVAARLARPADSVELWRERGFLLTLPDDDGELVLQRGSFDRVELWPDDHGGYQRATILDLKTDAVRGEAGARERAEVYAEQLHAYGRALCAMTGLTAEQVRTELLFLGPGLLVPV